MRVGCAFGYQQGSRQASGLAKDLNRTCSGACLQHVINDLREHLMLRVANDLCIICERECERSQNTICLCGTV